MDSKKVLTAALAASLALAAAAAAPRAAAVTLAMKGETVVLPNGMTWVLMPRTGAPTFAGYVAFRVGGVNSVPGNSGLAHMFEHMAFKGTEHLGTSDWEKEKPVLEKLQAAGDRLTLFVSTGKGTAEERAALEAEVKALAEEEHRYIVKDEIPAIYTRAGGRNLNASTAEDVTQYFVELPSNALELWMMVESQRVREPVMREFYSERDVIFQERLMRTDNDPMGKLYETYLATAFTAHPYRIPAVGYASDIKALTAAQARAFFHAYYSPSNAVGVLVGNFDAGRARALLGRYFGTIPRRGDPLPIVTKEPVQERERRAEVLFAANPGLFVGFHKPAWPSKDDTVMDVVSTLLTDGDTSRLYRRMVEKEGLAMMVQSYNGDPGALYDNLVTFVVIPNSGVPYAKVEACLYGELDRLASEPIPEEELQKAKTRILAGYLRRLESDLSTAALVGATTLVTGDWKTIFSYVADVQAVTAQDVRRVAENYLKPGNRTVVTLVAPAEPRKEKQP